MLFSPGQSEEGIPRRDGAETGGEAVGRFRLLAPLGSRRPAGAYAAADSETGAIVALKLGHRHANPAGSPEAEERAAARLRREAEVLQRLEHPGLPRLLFWSGEDQEPPHIALELIEAGELEQKLRTPSALMPAHELCELLAGIADTLAVVHREGFVHGDVQPANVLVRPDGRPVLVDFGCARKWQAERDQGDPQFISLTPGYAAPECHVAGKPIGPSTDLYSLGAIGYRVVTGRLPLSGADRLRGATMPSAVEIGSGIYPLALRAVLDWALEADPAARPASAEEWSEMLRGARGPGSGSLGDAAATVRVRRLRPGTAVNAPAGERPGAAADSGRRRTGWVAAITLGAAVSGALAWLGYHAYDERYRLEWLVDPAGGAHATSIQDALARARDGATIRVKPGVYRESLVIERQVALVGLVENGQGTVIEPDGSRCILLQSPAARLAELTIRGSRGGEGPCVDVPRGRVAIDRSEIASAAGPAISVRNGAELAMSESTVSGSGASGIVLAAGAKATILGSTVRAAAGSGILARGGAELVADKLGVEDSGQAGVLLVEGAAATLRGLTLLGSGSSGLEVVAGARASLSEAVIDRSKQTGVFVADGGRVEIERTRILQSGFSGLVAAPTGELALIGVEVASSREHGIVVMDHAGAAIRDTQAVQNAGHGLALQPLARFEGSGNTFERNKEPQLVDERRRGASRQAAAGR